MTNNEKALQEMYSAVNDLNVVVQKLGILVNPFFHIAFSNELANISASLHKADEYLEEMKEERSNKVLSQGE